MIETNMIFDETIMAYRCANCKNKLIVNEVVSESKELNCWIRCECGKINLLTKYSNDVKYDN